MQKKLMLEVASGCRGFIVWRLEWIPVPSLRNSGMLAKVEIQAPH